MKKFASLLLTVVLLATMLCMFAVSASAEVQTIPNSTLTWELTENDTKLIIDGKGAMPDFLVTSYENRPWHNAAETVTTVQINSGITTLGDYAFFHFEKLTSVSIPSSVQSIGKSVFEGCKNLTIVTIPSSVQSIGKSAFEGCKNLTIVTIPSGVTSIGSHAFKNCTSLTNVTISYGVTSIGPTVFYGCTSLESVTFPSSVMLINGDVFSGCIKLASVTVKASTPPTLKNLLLGSTNSKSAIYVPCGTSDDYKQATKWSESNTQIKEAYIVDNKYDKTGTITVDKDCFPTETYTEANETVTVTVTPADGYQLKADSLLVKYKENGAEKTADLTQDETDPMKYTFTMPCSNVTVTAEFEKITDNTETGSTLSDGNVWIIAAVAVVALGGVATLVIIKKKKKTALAGGENTDEE